MTLSVPDAGLRLVVISDTHSSPHGDSEALVRGLAPDHIVHAGDIGRMVAVDRFRAIAPVTLVRGNIDERGPELPDVVTMTLEAPDGNRLVVLLTHIALRGPRLTAGARRLARQEGAKLVLCGHSHMPLIGRDAEITLFNPGSIGPRRFALPITFGVLDVSPSGVRLCHWSCETGEEWRPPG